MADDNLNVAQAIKKLKSGSSERKYIEDVLKSTIKTSIQKTWFRGTASASATTYLIKVGLGKDHGSNYENIFTKIRGKNSNNKKRNIAAATVVTDDDVWYEQTKDEGKKKVLVVYFTGPKRKPFTVKFETTDKPWKDPKSVTKAGITTAQQEQISLKIFELVASRKTVTWKTFDQMYSDKKTGLQKLHPNLRATGDWWKHFELTFKEADETPAFENSKYDTFVHDDRFMTFISDLVTKGTGAHPDATFWKEYSKKDSWNPADVWLIRTGYSGSISPKFKIVKEQLKEALIISQINQIMKNAFYDKIIVGISLKKTNLKELRWEIVNLEGKVSAQKLKDIKYEKIDANFAYDKKQGFISRTSNLWVSLGGKDYQMSFRTSHAGYKDITYEFKGKGEKAQLGKVPKDRLKTELMTLCNNIPLMNVINFPSIKQNGIYESSGFGKKKDWQSKWNLIDKQLDTSNWEGWKEFIPNLQQSMLHPRSGKYNVVTNKNGVALQMFDFIYMVAYIKSKPGKTFITFLTKMFYFAQKKGQKYGFGPFGKIY